MPRQRWKLTQASAGQAEVDEFGERLSQAPRPFSLLAEIAKDPESGLREIAPGVYRIDRGLPVAHGHDQDGLGGHGQQE